jgi:hypothetical protein
MEKPKKVSLEDMRLDEVQRKMNDPKYSNQMYEKGVVVEMPGVVFADILEKIGKNQDLLVRMQNIVNNIARAVTDATNTQTAINDLLSIDLAELHMEYVDKGLTKTVEVETEQKDETNGAAN